MAKIVDPHKIADILHEQAAIHILPRFRQLASHEIMSKTSPTDLVTVADKEMELALIKILPDILPGSEVLGEEGVSSGDIGLEALDNTNRPIWVTDPVDGTFNFAHGKEDFCTMLALVVDGRTQISWIYDPLTSRMMIAEHGAGAFINDKKIELAPNPRPLSDMTGFVGLRYFPKTMRPHMQEQERGVKSMFTIGCAGHEYLRMGQGLVDFGIYTRVKPWDHLSGQLLIEEAGGYLSKWDGTPYTPQTRMGGILVVTDKSNWEPLHDHFLKKLIAEYQPDKK
jgi:fructose-1,6-bisphosphatase/inositol monophosphatase family enzyme